MRKLIVVNLIVFAILMIFYLAYFLTEINSILTIVTVIESILLFFGYFYFYKSLPYWKKTDFLDRVGWGILSLPHKYKKLKEPGKSYAKKSIMFYTIFIVIILVLVLFSILRLILGF